jgi:hypothetical protein
MVPPPTRSWSWSRLSLHSWCLLLWVMVMEQVNPSLPGSSSTGSWSWSRPTWHS